MARKQLGSLFKKTPDAAKWSGAYTDPHTKRRVVVSLFTDRRSSRKRLDEIIVAAEQRAAGVLDRFEDHRVRPIAEHIADYLAHCKHIGESPVHVGNKETQLDRLIKGTGATRLSDLEPNRVEQHLQILAKSGRTKAGDADKGLSARSVNQHRATAVAFVAWCVQTQRAPDNPLKIVPKLDERRDRRRVRRAFTGEELRRLFSASHVRRSVFLIAAFTGLRRGELAKIVWGDVDLERDTLTIRVGVGKAAREDRIALHPDAAAELASLRPAGASARDRVFDTLPRDRTFRADLKRPRSNRSMMPGEWWTSTRCGRRSGPTSRGRVSCRSWRCASCVTAT